MKHKKVVLGIATAAIVLLLAGCAPQANQVGAFVPVPPISNFITGFLQGAFILWVVIWNLLSFLIPWGHYDVYQDGVGIWYDIGFIIGLSLGVGTGLFGYRRVGLWSRRRRE